MGRVVRVVVLRAVLAVALAGVMFSASVGLACLLGWFPGFVRQGLLKMGTPPYLAARVSFGLLYTPDALAYLIGGLGGSLLFGERGWWWTLGACGLHFVADRYFYYRVALSEPGYIQHWLGVAMPLACVAFGLIGWLVGRAAGMTKTTIGRWSV